MRAMRPLKTRQLNGVTSWAVILHLHNSPKRKSERDNGNQSQSSQPSLPRRPSLRIWRRILLLAVIRYEPIDDISRVSSYARLAKWKSLSGDEKNVMRPVDAKDYEGWLVEEHSLQYIVAVSHGQFRGKPTQVCQVSVNMPAEPLLSKIISKVRVGKPTSAVVGLQMNEIYQLLQHPTGRTAFMLVARSKDKGEPFINIGFIRLQ